MTLKYKIITTIATLLFSVSLITSIVNYQIDVQATQHQLKDISLPLSVDNIYTEIQQRMIEPLIVSSLLSNDTFLKDWVLSGEKDIKAISKYLKEIQNKYAVFTAFLVSDATKNYYHSKGLIDKVNENNVEDDWFFNFKKLPEAYEVNLDYNKNLGNSLIMFINYKVYDYANTFIAATGVGIELLNIEHMLDSFKQKYRYDVYFVDMRGEIVLHSKKLNKRGNISNIEGLKKIQPAIFSKKTEQFEYKSKDDEYLLSTKYIEKLKLFLLVEINKKEYLQELQKTFYINLFISLLITFLVVLIIVYAINIYQKQLEKTASEDALTGLYNRRKFNEYFESVYRQYKKSINTITLVLIDIDNFKEINDTCGHLSGDRALVRVGQILHENLRKTDMIARWGGEEFALLFCDIKKDDVVNLCEMIRIKVQEDKELCSILGEELTISLGLGELANEDSQDGLVSKVDKALYSAKNKGKNQLVIV